MILVVGGAGFVGSLVAAALRDAGTEHLIFDSLEKGHRAAMGDSPFVMGDIRRAADLERVFAEFPISLVMHFAAYIEVGESYRDPSRYWWNNVTGTLSLLEAMRNHGVDRLVFSSTAAVYGEPENLPLTEDHPKRPTSPYGASKWAAEQMMASFSDAYGLQYVALRYFNASGCDPAGRLGEDHRPESHLIPIAIDAALGRREALTLFGEDWETPDGTCIRDYVHVSDLSAAHLLAADYLRDGGTRMACNLGTGTGFSVREVLSCVEKVAGPVPTISGDRRPGDPERLVASSGHAREVLGWEPKHPDLETIVRHAWAWRSAHPDGYGD